MNSMMKKLVGCVGLMMSLALASQAGQYWWSGNGTTLGGNGTWNTNAVSSNWSATGAAPFGAWPNGADEAIFTNAAGTVTLSGAVNVNKITFDVNNYTIPGGTLNLTGANPTFTKRIGGENTRDTVSSALSGSSDLTLVGYGNYGGGISLYGNNSNYTGRLIVTNAMELSITNDFNLGCESATLIPGAVTVSSGLGGQLRNYGSDRVSVSAKRGITLGGWVSIRGAFELNSPITGAGGIMFRGGTLGSILNSSLNDYAGTTDIYEDGGNSSYLLLGADNALPHGTGKGDIWLRCWSTGASLLDMNGHNAIINGLTHWNSPKGLSNIVDNVSAGGTVTLTLGGGNATAFFAGQIRNTTGTLNLTKIGTGSQTLSGTNSYSGTTTVNGGTLVVSGALSNAVPLTVNAGGTLQADLTTNPGGVFNFASSVTLAGGTLNIKGKNSGTSSQALANLTVNPAGSTISLTPNGGAGTTLTLSNTWTRLVGGTLLVDLSAAGVSTVTSSPTLTNGIIGGYAFVKDGTGTGFATVSAGNVVRYTGATVLDAAAAAANLDGTVNYMVTNSVTLSGSSATQTVNSLSITGVVNANTITPNGKVLVVGAGGINYSASAWARLTSGGYITSGTGDLVFNIVNTNPDVGPIVDNGATKVGVTKTGAGQLLINAGNTYSGDTVINQGQLVRGACIPNGVGKGNLLVNAGAIFEMGGSSGGINGLSQSMNNTGGTVQNGWGGLQTLTLGNGDASASYSGTIIHVGGGGIALVKVGTGTQTFSGVNTYAGGTILSNGVLSVSSTNNIGGANAKVTFAGGTLRITGTTFTGFGATPITVSGNVGLDIVEASNAFTFTNDVPGTLTKTGAGGLSVSGSVASLVTDNRTRVGGSGSVAAWTLKSLTGGAYTPAGIEAVTGTLTLEGNYTFDLNADGTGDKLTASGAVTMNSIVITIPVPANLTDKSKVYTLVEGSSLSGTFSLASVLPQDWKLKKEGNALVVRYVSPGTMVSFY